MPDLLLEGLNVNISGGTINLTAEDDGLNAASGNDQSGFGGPRKNDRFGGGSFANGSPESSSSAAGNIIISGGCLNITASGDGLDSNGSLIISGGETIICGPTIGDTSILDYETSGTITGGTFIGTGSSHMFQSFSDFQQSIITAGISSQSDETGLTLSDKKGNSIINVSPALPYEAVVISCPELKKGETYILTAGNNTYEVQAE
ncbi:MAG: hypothetical protein SOW08_10130 [Lachnospiraceae bacterium]|nr:hypothetical protein [Lachnospiraceae bacterium]